MTSAVYHVTGMTCEHCARAVTTELEALDGVSDVAVDLVPGGTSAVTVASGRPLSLKDVEAALDEAGDYRITEPGEGPATTASRAGLPVIN
ncbi:MAG TPA: heavy-metal-associated domain-containing protein [Trebonia sp.]|nr:heavy-metal-associated domain-containing protein [Trebonia sp.]